MDKNDAFINMRYDESEECLIIQLTDNISFSWMKMIRIHLWPEVEHMTRKEVDIRSSNGTVYKKVNQYTIPAYKDRVDIFFDAAKSVLSQSIKKSIVNSDN